MTARTEKAAALLLVHGEEPFLVDGDARAWLRRARAEALSDLDLEVFDAQPRVDAVRRSLASVPFLAERRFVLLRDPPQLAERPRRGADSADDLAAALRERSPQTEVCVVAHRRVAPQNPVLAVARAEGRVVEHRRPRGRELRSLAEGAASQRGLQLPREAIELLLRVSGGDLGILDAEMAKLAAFAAGRSRLTLAEVRSLAAGSEHLAVWDVVDRLVTPPHGGGAAAVDSLLADGVSTQQLVAVLARQLREILEAQEILGDHGRHPAASRELEDDLGLQPWQAERLARWAAAVPAGAAVAWLHELQRLDAQSKLGKADDVAGLRSLVLRAARALTG